MRARSTCSWWFALAAMACASCGDDAVGPDDDEDATSSQSSSSTGGSTGSVVSTGGAGGEEDDDLPVAVAGADFEIGPGEVVQLDGSESYDPDGWPVFYQWFLYGGGTLTSADTATPTFTAPTYPGIVTARLYVEDYGENQAFDEVAISVVGFPPVLTVGPDVGGFAGDTLTLSAEATEPDGDVITYTWTQIGGPPVALSDSSGSPTLVLPPGLTEHLVYEVVATDPDGSSEPEWVTVVELTGPDSDGDFVEDTVEASLGTNPASPDTDADGIPDGWELGVHEGVDFAGMGCSPLHRDLLVEVDYQEGALPGATLFDAWTSYYATLPVTNVDGQPGIAAHFVVDSVLPPEFVCPTPFGGGDPPLENPVYREAFHILSICKNGGGGVATIGGRYLAISVLPWNADPSDDLEEPEIFETYWLMLHEMGHSLGLFHGGGDDVNHKPNYPSYMNYDYDGATLGSPYTLADGVVRLSRGTRPDVDECALVESGAYAGVSTDDCEDLGFYIDPPGGWPVEADGSVDWNRDGSITSTPYELIIRSSTQEWGSQNHPDCTLLIDYDDIALIESKMASSILSDPAAPQSMQLRRLRRIEWVP